MNFEFAKEVGYVRYVLRRLRWRLGIIPKSILLHTGVKFFLPQDNFFASDVFVSDCNVDWNSEFILAAYLKQFSKGGDFLDVGSHLGYYSALLSPLVNKVYAFEPDVRNHYNLNKSAAIVPNMTVIPMAVSDTNGRVGFCSDGESSVSHIVDRPPSTDVKNSVDCMTIDRFVLEHEVKPRAIKIDIEGFDILALRGAISTAVEHQPVFLVEYNQESGRPNTWAALSDFLIETGYSLFAVSRKSHGFLTFRYTMARYEVDEVSTLGAKMIFLIPSTHLTWFQDFSKFSGSWGMSALRSKSVKVLISTGRLL
jgi:FkbM family methyltransferase